MHRIGAKRLLAGTRLCLACALAIAVISATAASAQQPAPMLPTDPGYIVATETDAYAPAIAAQQYQQASSAAMAGDEELAARVKALEAALKKIQDKAAADAKRAASAPSVKVFGRIHADWATFYQNASLINMAGDFYNGAEFRRARIGAQGEAFDVMDYRIEMDFAGSGQPAFKDVYGTIKELPLLGNVRVGHFKEPWGLEQYGTSANYITFMERSLIDQSGGFCTVGDRKSGIMAFDWNESERMTWAYGVFISQVGERPPTWPTAPFDDAGGTAFTARITWLPWYDEATEGRGYLHTGLAYAYHDIAELRPNGNGRFTLSAKPEANLAGPVLYATNLNDFNRVNALRPELLLTYGPLSFQAEYAWFWISRAAGASPMFDGGYLQVSYFLTGEHRAYDRRRGGPTRVKPFENFFRVRDEDGYIHTGKGAWELAYRASYLNGNSAGILAGQVIDHTFGVNWYLNPYSRVMFNIVHSEVTGRDTNSAGTSTGTVFPVGVMDAFMTRFQVDF